MPLASSLWLDETLTYWNVMKGGSDIFARSAVCAGQFQIYMFITALSANFFGLNEIGLRLPSIIASLCSSWLMFQLGRRFADTGTGIFAAILFVCIPEIILQAGNARPYALVIFFSLLAVWQLVKLHDTGEWHYVASYATAAAAMVYMHYISAPFLLVLVFFSALRFKSTEPIKLFWAHLLPIILIAPLVILILTASKDTATISFTDTPDVRQLMSAVFSNFVLSAISIYIACKIFLRKRVETFFPLFAFRTTLFIVLWFLVPISICYLISVTTNYKIFVDRYYVYAYPALALLLAAILQKIRHTTFCFMALVSLCIISFFSVGINEIYPSLHHEDWRGALTAVKSMAEPTQIPLLFNSGLIETLQPGWERQTTEHHLLSPLAIYPVKTNVTALPFGLTSKSRTYLESVITPQISSLNKFVVVLRRCSGSVDSWFKEYAVLHGFERREVGNFEGVLVVLYERKNLDRNLIRNISY